MGPASTNHLGLEGPVTRGEDGMNPGDTALGLEESEDGASPGCTALGREESGAKEDGMNPGRTALGRGRSGVKDGTATMKGSGPSQEGRSRSRAERRPGLGTRGLRPEHVEVGHSAVGIPVGVTRWPEMSMSKLRRLTA